MFQSVLDDDECILYWDLGEEAFHIKTDQTVLAINLHYEILSTKFVEFFSKELVPPESGGRTLASFLARS